jgi:hypothetical protein
MQTNAIRTIIILVVAFAKMGIGSPNGCSLAGPAAIGF